MPRNYVDNAMNRSLGRVGMAVGSMPVSRGSSSGVGSFGSSSSSFSPKTYVDNALNRSSGRVGMPVGSMPMSKGSSYSGYSDRNSRLNDSATSVSYGSSNSKSQAAKSYVDNAHNRKLGRAGAPLGSMPESKGSSYSGYSDRNSKLNYSATSMSHVSSNSKIQVAKTYVDNAQNRKLGRAGAPLGSMPVSKGSSYSGYGDRNSRLNDSMSYASSNSESQAAKTYVDNAHNRKLGRAGKPLGSKTTSKKSEITDTIENSKDVRGNEKTYVDNAYNRKYGRVGKPLGSYVISQRSEKTDQYSRGRESEASSKAASKVYKDNPMNRRLGRVGEPLGSMPVKRKSQMTESTRQKIEEMLQTYTGPCGDYGECDYGEYDTDIVREDPLRFGEYDADIVRGDPLRFGEYDTDIVREDPIRFGEYDADIIRDHPLRFGEYDADIVREEPMRQAFCYFNRLLEEMKLKDVERTPCRPEEKTGTTISFEELELGKMIGCGGFGEIYFAKWKGLVVAVKKLKAAQVSKRRLGDFVREMALFYQLDHPNIVRFIGACVERPDLCIVMEYMQMSLFDALHIRDDHDFSETQRLHIIRQTCNGLMYLHNSDIAHRDLKTSNVLIDCEGEKGGETVKVKITDFGLSSMRNNIESSVSYGGEAIGTPRYSAPEILRGDRGLTVEDYKKADIYSMSLVLFEVVFEEEPFYDFNLHQLVKYVGTNGVSPEVPENPAAADEVLNIMKRSWSFKSQDRPQIADVLEVFRSLATLYVA